MSKDIKQRVTFNASPQDVFEALMDAKQHAAFTGGKARISKKPGGRFQIYDGFADGVNVEVTKARRIVQAWRAADWPTGAYSIATFNLEAAAGNKTKLVFTQSGVPNKHHKRIEQGWKDYYWKPLKMYLASRK